MHPSALTVDEIARAMGLGIPDIWTLARNMDRAFWPTRRKRVRGKEREIDSPRPYEKYLLRKLHRFMQKNLRAHKSVHGGTKRRSCFTSAREHLGRRYVVTRDVQNAYPSISRTALKSRLLKLGFRSDTALLLSLLCSVHGRLAQGSPVSSDAMNLFFFDADRAIAAACGTIGAAYSRTYDDMVISLDSRARAEWPGGIMRKQIDALGLTINQKKLQKAGFRPGHCEQRVHNLVVNSRHGVRIPAEQVKKATDLAESYLRGAKVVSANTLESLAQKRSEVTGWMYYCQQADFGPAKNIRRMLDAGDRHVLQALKAANLGVRHRKWWVMAAPYCNEPARLAAAWNQQMAKSLYANYSR